jgi:hypothetical protein
LERCIDWAKPGAIVVNVEALDHERTLGEAFFLEFFGGMTLWRAAA